MKLFNTMPPKTQFVLAACGTVFLIGLLFWFAFFFLFAEIRNESSEIETAKIRRISLEARRAEAKRQETTLATLHNDIRRVENAFVEHPLSFFEFLENLAARNNLSVSLVLENQGGDETKKPERLRVTISGAYRSLIRFARGLEAAPYVTDTQSMALQILNQRPEFSDSLARLSIDIKFISK